MADTSRRTGISGLKDAELELLDALVIWVGSRASLRAKSFPGQYNRPSHGFDDVELKAILDRFEKEGWTTGEDYTNSRSEADRSVIMTPTGGQVWESERLPDWTRHVMDRGSGGAPERSRIAIFGHSPVIVRAFFDAGRAGGFFNFAAGPIHTGSAQRKWIYWRPPQTLFLLSAWVEPWNREGEWWKRDVDWQLMESMRCWWRFPDEIGTLWGLPPA
jgi:hypothetical protein